MRPGLVVGVSSDDSSRAGRPARAEAIRAAALGGMAAVDLVCILNEGAPDEMIQALAPDLLIKRAEDKQGAAAGAEFVQSYGGQVIWAEPMPEHEAAAAVQRLRSV